jgi:hypothetical protein
MIASRSHSLSRNTPSRILEPPRDNVNQNAGGTAAASLEGILDQQRGVVDRIRRLSWGRFDDHPPSKPLPLVLQVLDETSGLGDKEARPCRPFVGL